jgi:tetratricopeptide (TPR) repeat protein
MSAIRKAVQLRIAFALGILLAVIGSGCSPSGPKALLQGEQLIKQGQYEPAVRKLEVAAKKLPNYPQVWNFLGLAYHGQGKLNEALASYQKALNIDRNYAAAQYNLGLVLFDLNRLPEALSALSSFAIVQPNSEEAWLKIASIQLRLQKSDDAERAAAQALKVNPGSPEALNDLGIIALQRRKGREALQWFDRALQAQADYAPAILNQAVILQGMPGNKALALQRYKAYLSLEPNSKEAPVVRQNIAVLSAELAPPPVKTPPTAVAATNALPAAEEKTAVASDHSQARPDSSRRNGASADPSTNIAAAASRLPLSVSAEKADPQEPKSSAPVKIAGPVVIKPPVAAVSKNSTGNLGEPQPHTIQSLRTNQNALAHAASPVPLIAATNKPAEAVPLEQLQPVTIQDNFTLKPVRDLPAARTNMLAANTETPTREAAMTNSAMEPSNRIANSTKNRGNDESDSGAQDSKTGVASRLNPVNWFRWKKSKDKDDEPPASALEESGRVAMGTRPAPPAPKKAALEMPRYPFKKQMNLPQGDRAKAEIPYNKAVAAHQEKRVASAIEWYMEAVKLDPSYFQAYYNLALAAYQINDLPIAMSAGEAAVFLKPGSIDARYNFALALRDAHYYRDAADQLKELLVDSPDDVRAHFTLANIYAQNLEEPQLAQTHYLKVLELDARHPQAAQIRYWLSRAN